jgi:hypothetical protein
LLRPEEENWNHNAVLRAPCHFLKTRSITIPGVLVSRYSATQNVFSSQLLLKILHFPDGLNNTGSNNLFAVNPSRITIQNKGSIPIWNARSCASCVPLCGTQGENRSSTYRERPCRGNLFIPYTLTEVLGGESELGESGGIIYENIQHIVCGTLRGEVKPNDLKSIIARCNE